MDADEIVNKLDRIADRRIQEAIEAGEFNNLAGAGKPLTQKEENPFVPADMRAAFTILSNSGYAPDWMVLAQQIDADIERLRYDADRHFVYLKEKLLELGSNPYAVKRLRSEVQRLKAHHKRAAAQHSHDVEEINRKISLFNQTVPIASLMRIPLSLSQEMHKYEERVPGYLSYVQ
ncbi:MAG: DUF1992 domain-containing protein [Chloroflexi bacterium]|nr:DUF1992 domain-containing protein [Chloroflexota bacterium]